MNTVRRKTAEFWEHVPDDYTDLWFNLTQHLTLATA